MKMEEKIIMLRKKFGWSQEELAEKVCVSRQAVSRWENGTALPDAQNVLQLSKLFQVSTDYLLNDDYASDEDIPIVQAVKHKTDVFISKRKVFHLSFAVGFTIATFFSILGVTFSTSNVQLGLSCFLVAFCAGNAAAQYVLYFKNPKV